MTNDGAAMPWKARLLLICGGIFGSHRLYLKQIPEAFIYFSTAGVFLLGPLYDTFLFRYEVNKYNKLVRDSDDVNGKEKYKKGKLQAAQSKFVPFSFTRFIFSVLYGNWLGILAWLACTVTFSWSDVSFVPFICVLAVAVTAGVYMIGQCGGQSRDLTFIWLSAFSAAFVLIRIAHVGVFRAIFFTAIASTVIGNRSARYRNNQQRRYTWKHFAFWSSLFCMLMCVIVLGCSRKIIQRQVTATRPGKFQESASVGSLMRDRFLDERRVHSFFRDNPSIEYTAKSVDSDENVQRAKSSESKSVFWKMWNGDILDEWLGTAHIASIDWVELTTVFIVDLLRCESRVLESKLKVEPLQWAAWRNYLISRFDKPPLVADDEIFENCRKWLRVNYGEEKEKKEKKERDFGSMATRKACLTLLT